MVEPKDQKLTVMMSDSDMERLRELAEVGEVSISHVVRHLVRIAHEAAFVERTAKRKR
jgi:GTP cyclohydrolase FolE2